MGPIRHLVFLALLTTLGLSGRAHAAEPAPTDAETPGRPELGYWSVGKERWFLSTKSDLGLYAKPYFSAGYGMPHWIWAGLDVNGIVTNEVAQFYAGVRGATPVFDVAFGVRDTYSWSKPFLTPRATFTPDDVKNEPGSNARYWAWELELIGIVPLPYSAIMLNFIAVSTLDVPKDKFVYEESYRLILGDTSYQILRAATVARFLNEDALKAGLLYELLINTGRDKNVFRMGPAFAFQLTDHLEAVGTLSVALHSPDSLGLVLGSYGLAGLRYRWATGERDPKWPWQGQLIPFQ